MPLEKSSDELPYICVPSRQPEGRRPGVSMWKGGISMSMGTVIWILTIVICAVFMWISWKVKDDANVSFSNQHPLAKAD